MAKPHCRVALALAPLALLVSQAAGAAWKFTPDVEVKETYTDNLRRAPPDQARSEWITQITPGFRLSNHGRRLRFDASYRLNYYTGADDASGDDDRVQSQLAARMDAVLLDDWLYIDGAASIGQRPISAFGPSASRAYANNNATEVRTYRVSPYLRHRFGSTATAELRYEFDSVDTGRIRMRDSDSRTAALKIASEPGSSDLGWNLLVRERRIDGELAPEISESTALLGLQYTLGRTLAATASIGYDEFDYQALGGVTAGRSWSGGLIWAPSQRTKIDARVGRRFYGDSYFLSANHRSRRTAWSLNYSDAVTNSRSQFLLPSTVDTAALLDSMFLSAFPEPEARRQAVEAYMRATGLPPTLADSINYFSSRYFLQKQLRAALVMRGARTRTVLSAYATRRDALSTGEVDSALLGPTAFLLNSNTRQRGASALWSYRVSPTVNFNADFDVNRTESLSTGRIANHRLARLSLTRQFDRKLSGLAELRRMSGPTSGFTEKYVEHAISVALAKQF